MSNEPTLPPVAEPQRKSSPLPVLANESDARLQAALAASARADASLTGLFRAIQQLGNGLGGAREANESLALELEGLRDLLGVASEQQQIFERKISELEQVLDRTRKEHAHERGYLIDQQDLFLVKLLDEQELERTAQKLAEDRERARETVARLQAQRDEAQIAVARIERERDEALHEIHRL